jgi:hypothetical protein
MSAGPVLSLASSRSAESSPASGSYLALLCLAGSLLEGFRAPTHNWIGLAILLFGLALLLLDWKELE